MPQFLIRPDRSPLTTYDEVKLLTAKDLGEPIKSPARASHVHLFGISFIFPLTGTILSLSSTRQSLKIPVPVIPFAAILMDIGSWRSAKYEPFFARTVIIGGALTTASLAVQVSGSL